MSHNQRIFVEAIGKYCVDHDIAIEVRCDGWLVVMRRGARRHLAFGYDVGLNSATAHQIANDKSATAEILKLSGVPCIPHTLFLGPKLNLYLPSSGSWEAMLGLLSEYPRGLVIKPNEGTSGDSVFVVTTKRKLELAVSKIFSAYPSLAISPYVDIDDEIRVVLVDDDPVVIYRKNRPTVVGDGAHSLLELALAATPPEQRSTVLTGMIGDLDKADLDAMVPKGVRRVLNWRHNLDSGAQPVILEQGKIRDACIQIATEAAKAIGIRFASIDVVRVGGAWQILELNSGVKMEALARSHPELVYAAYGAALDKLFG
jgi:glutathione synthase/RimK-type ligase-like ATP-grasp enzyme